MTPHPVKPGPTTPDRADDRRATTAAADIRAATATTAAAATMAIPQYNSPFVRRSRWLSRLAIWLCAAAAGAAILLLLFILGFVFWQGISSMSWSLFTDDAASGGLSNAIAGSLIIVGLASLLGIPLGMLCGIYLANYATDTWFARVVRACVDIVASVPSIIIGIVAFQVLTIGLGFNPSGFNGALALGLMMCPIVAKTTEEMLRLVPGSFREASLALGASHTQTLWRVILPAASAGIITGALLSVARVASETAPLLFTIQGNSFLTWDPSEPMSALPLQIYQYAISANPEWRERAWAGMLILVLMVLSINLAIRLTVARIQRVASAPRKTHANATPAGAAGTMGRPRQ